MSTAMTAHEGGGFDACRVHAINGMTRSPPTNDLATFKLSMPTDMYTTCVMQFGTDDELANYVEKSEQDRVTILHTVLARNIDRPLYITMPEPTAVMLPYSAIIIATSAAQEEYVLGIANSISPVHEQSGNGFVLKHATNRDEDASHIVKVAMRLALWTPLSWDVCLYMTLSNERAQRNIDMYKTLVANDIRRILNVYYCNLEQHHGNLRIFIWKTYAASMKASCDPGIVHEWLTTAKADIVPALRVLLLRRLLVASEYRSTLPDVQNFMDVVSHGACIEIGGTAMQVETDQNARDFKRRMLARQNA